MRHRRRSQGRLGGVTTVVLLAVFAAVLVVTTRDLGGAQPSRPFPGAPVAGSAQSLVDSFGVAIHLDYSDTPYADLPAVVDAVDELGVRHLRTGLVLDPALYRAIRTVAAETGARFDLVARSAVDGPTPAETVATIAAQFRHGEVEQVEGVNEWDLSNRPDWAAEARRFQEELYRAVKGNRATLNLPVLAPALGRTDTFKALGDLTEVSDAGNLHIYPGGRPPSADIETRKDKQALVTGEAPVYVTEAGYHNALNSTESHFAVPEDVAGVYAPRLLLEHYLRGISRMYYYELLDEHPDPEGLNKEASFGLLRYDFSPTPAFTALRNLLALARDSGAGSGAGSRASALAHSIEGADDNLRQVLLTKSDGSNLLILWRDVSVFDQEHERRLEVTEQHLIVNFGRRVAFTVYHPSSSATPVSTGDAASADVGIRGEVVVLDVAPSGEPVR